MPYDDEISPYGNHVDVPAIFHELTHKVIGAAIEVHRRLGPGLPEEEYQKACEVEFAERGIVFERQKAVVIVYKGVVVARGKVDLLVGSCLIVEVKAVEALLLLHRLQVRTYIRILNQPLGHLINFNVPLLKAGIKRVIDTEQIVD